MCFQEDIDFHGTKNFYTRLEEVSRKQSSKNPKIKAQKWETKMQKWESSHVNGL